MPDQILPILAQAGTFGGAIVLAFFMVNRIVIWMGQLKGRNGNGNGTNHAALATKLNAICVKVDKLDDKLQVLIGWHEPENGEQLWKGTRTLRGINEILDKLKDLDSDYKGRYKHLADKVDKIGDTQ